MVGGKIRTLLFAPGDSRRKLERAIACDADGVICDLEDSVSADFKTVGRATVLATLGGVSTTCAKLIRVNPRGSDLEADLEVARKVRADALVLPKATPDLIAALPRGLPPIVAIVETAAGVRSAFEIASAPGVSALMLGSVDLGTELGLEPQSDGRELLLVRSTLVIDSAAAGIRPPIDGIHRKLDDDAGLEEEAVLARSLGFGGKACIHPRQVPIVNDAFSPSQSSLEWARAVVEGYEDSLSRGQGAVQVDGEMIDRPVFERARLILTRSPAARTAGASR
jgi:citrate lyase beta subunit